MLYFLNWTIINFHLPTQVTPVHRSLLIRRTAVFPKWVWGNFQSPKSIHWLSNYAIWWLLIWLNWRVLLG